MNENPFRRSSRVLNEKLIYEILSVVEEIPAGCVATYGQIACLIGNVLNQAENYGNYPCHRVVNHAGRLVPGWHEQEFLLKEEGIPFKENGCVDLKLCQWEY